jgi:hypothetical protein
MAHDDKRWANKSRRYRREAEKITRIPDTVDAPVEAIKNQNALGMHCSTPFPLKKTLTVFKKLTLN